MNTRSPLAQTTVAPRGYAVLEALLVASALALGLLAATRLAERAWQAGAHSRTQAQAQRLARQALDCVLAQPSSTALACASARSNAPEPNAYEVVLDVRPLGAQLQEVWVQVSGPPQGREAPPRWRWGTRVTPLAPAPEASMGGAALGVSSGP